MRRSDDDGARNRPTASRTVQAAPPPGARLAGIDAARGLALLAMMATHVLPTFESGRPAHAHLDRAGVFRTRARAVRRAGRNRTRLVHRETAAAPGAELWAARRGIALRALVIGAVGLSLGGLEVNIAIILVHYALLVPVRAAVPRAGRQTPAGTGGRLGAGDPALAFLLRPWLLSAEPPLQLGHNPKLGGPVHAGSATRGPLPHGLLPCPAVDRLSPGRPGDRPDGARRQRPCRSCCVAVGTAVAVLAKWLSVVMMEDWGGRAALQATLLIPSIRWRASCRSTWPAWTSPAPPGGWPPVPRIRAPRWICCTPRGWRPPSSALCLLLGRLGDGGLDCCSRCAVPGP